MQTLHKFSIFLSLCLLMLLPALSHAQKLSKDELKKLKNELKSLTPEQWQEKKRESEKLKTAENIANATVLDLKAQRKKLEGDIEKAEKSASEQETILASLPKKKYRTPKDANRAYYRVQVGAYFNSALAQALQSQQAFEVEQMGNGMKRYLVGKFNSFGEATKLVELMRLSNEQAFVVGYLDGKRLNNLKEMPDELKK